MGELATPESQVLVPVPTSHEPSFISNGVRMKSDQEEPESQPQVKSQKRTYDSPRLITYGSIQEITQSVAVTGNLDGVAVLKTQ